jgi:hypothetical protein
MVLALACGSLTHAVSNISKAATAQKVYNGKALRLLNITLESQHHGDFNDILERVKNNECGFA